MQVPLAFAGSFPPKIRWVFNNFSSETKGARKKFYDQVILQPLPSNIPLFQEVTNAFAFAFEFGSRVTEIHHPLKGHKLAELPGKTLNFEPQTLEEIRLVEGMMKTLTHPNFRCVVCLFFNERPWKKKENNNSTMPSIYGNYIYNIL